MSWRFVWHRLRDTGIGPGDAVLALGLLAFALAEVVALPELDRRVAVPAAFGMTIPLLWRRVVPIVVVGTTFGSFALQVVGGIPDDAQLAPLAALLAACYSAGAYAEIRTAAAGLALAWLLGGLTVPLDPESTPSDAGFVLLVTTSSWSIGRLVRSRTGEVRVQRQRAEEAAAAAEERARLAAEAERRRIARELHDIIAHSISMMVVQAGGAGRVVLREPQRAAEALEAIQRTGRQSMTDLHQLLGLLREPGQEEALDPQPGLGDLDQLIAETRAAGVDVEMTVTGEPPEVGGGIGLSVYRVVQEALTNVAKHAPDASAGVYVHYAPDEIRVRVADGGSPARRRAAEPGGRGLVGMRERAALFGGELTAGPGPEGGFVVEARFPAGRGTGS